VTRLRRVPDKHVFAMFAKTCFSGGAMGRVIAASVVIILFLTNGAAAQGSACWQFCEDQKNSCPKPCDQANDQCQSACNGNARCVNRCIKRFEACQKPCLVQYNTCVTNCF
jgi:hypothetical protein